MRNAIITIAAGLMLMTVTSGCASWTTSKPKNNNSMWSRMQFWKKPYQRPQKMAAIWTHDILTMTAKPPTRGFGGRIYFYNDKSQAIPVDGELIVHGYEETSVTRPDLEKTKADKTFMFTAEQFTEHFSSSELGASYSVWIPWDAADGMQKQITLIPTFKGTDGSLVQGEPAKLILPGRTIEEPTRPTSFQQVSYEQSVMSTVNGPLPVLGGMKTTTISRPSKINLASKKSSQKANYETQASVPANSGFTTEVRYGNNPLTGSGPQLTLSGPPPASRALSLYPNQAPGAVKEAQNIAMPNSMTNTPNTTYPGGMSNVNYPGAMPNPGYAPNNSYPGAMPNMTHPGMMPNTQPSQPGNGQPENGQPWNGQPWNGQPWNGQPWNGQPGNGQPTYPLQQQPNAPTNLPNHMTPGFAGFSPVEPQAVQSAFAVQWQPFGQPPIPLIQQPQTSQVQQAGYSQSATGVQAPGQPQAMPLGQSNSLNRF